MFFWKGISEDSCYEVHSKHGFEDRKECYDDMRNAALEKAKWNTQYDEDFENSDDVTIGYRFSFVRKCILHSSWSGRYVYVLYEDGNEPTDREMIAMCNEIEPM